MLDYVKINWNACINKEMCINSTETNVVISICFMFYSITYPKFLKA